MICLGAAGQGREADGLPVNSSHGSRYSNSLIAGPPLQGYDPLTCISVLLSVVLLTVVKTAFQASLSVVAPLSRLRLLHIHLPQPSVVWFATDLMYLRDSRLNYTPAGGKSTASSTYACTACAQPLPALQLQCDLQKPPHPASWVSCCCFKPMRTH